MWLKQYTILQCPSNVVWHFDVGFRCFAAPRIFLNVGILGRNGLMLYFICLPNRFHCHNQRSTHLRWRYFYKTVSQVLRSCSKCFCLLLLVVPIKIIKKCSNLTTKTTYWLCLVAIYVVILIKMVRFYVLYSYFWNTRTNLSFSFYFDVILMIGLAFVPTTLFIRSIFPNNN